MTRTLRVVASGILLALVAWRTDWRQVADAFARLDLRLWLLGVALYAITQVVSSLRWALLARPLGFQQPLSRFLRYYYVGMFFNLVLPTSVGGDVVRAWYLDERSGRRGAALLTVLIDRGSGLLVLLALACVAAALSPVVMPRWLPWSVWGVGLVSILGLIGLLLLANRGKNLPIPERIRQLLGSLHDLQTIYSPRRRLLVAALLLSVVVQAANVILVWLIGLALGTPVPASYYWILVPVVTLLTLVPLSLNGMGVREGATVLLLSPLGVDEGTALSLAFLWFAAFTVVSLLGVGCYLLGALPRFEGRSDDEPVGGHSDQGRAGQLKAAA